MIFMDPKLITLYEKGEIVFRNVDEFDRWLNMPFDTFKTLKDLTATSEGIDILLEELDKISHGYPV